MKTIGLIGGMSWESTIPYYRALNEAVKQQLGGLHSARCILYSVDFHDIERLQHAGDWNAAGAMLADAARSLEQAGADFLLERFSLFLRESGDIEDDRECAVVTQKAEARGAAAAKVGGDAGEGSGIGHVCAEIEPPTRFASHFRAHPLLIARAAPIKAL